MPVDGAHILEAVGFLLAEHERELDGKLAAVRRELEALPPPEPGAPGKPGLDRVLAAPCTIGELEHCERNTIAHHAGGLWQAIRSTTGDPTRDPAGWKCLVPGIARVEFGESYARRELEARFVTSDGETHAVRWRMPATYLPHDWQQRGWGIIAGDILRDEGADYVALVDDPGNPLAEASSGNWHKVAVVGRRGRPGDKGNDGDPGAAGPGLTGLKLVRDGAGALALLPEYADPRVRAEPLAVDLLLEPPANGLDLIVGFGGAWHAGKRYARGVVVSSLTNGAGALWLSLAADNTAPLGSPGWRRMV